MFSLSALWKNKFTETVINDGGKALSGIEASPTDISLPEEVELDEYQYYIHKVGFYLVHTLTWCKQLGLAIEFFSNFNYSKKIEASRADHLIYNIENYLIRLNSVYDRILQLVNAVFHLCIHEESVGHSVIISNYKVQHRPDIMKKVKNVKKYLDNYSKIRHTLIHKHSWQDINVRRIELFYMVDIHEIQQSTEWKQEFKNIRSSRLRSYISEKKDEFIRVNSELTELLDGLFSELLSEYTRQTSILR